MDDKILESKKKLKRIASDRKRNRIEKYQDIKTTIVEMDDTSKMILYKEFKRDFELEDLLEHTGVLITISLPVVSLFTSLSIAFFNGKKIMIETWTELSFILILFILFLIVLYSLCNIFVGYRKRIVKNIIDIFDEIQK